jgi:hypothetical protein
MAKETKKTEEKEDEKSSLSQRLNDITFKNDQVQMVRNLQSENAKLKQMVGRRKSAANTPRIQGLGKLEGNLGMQFKKRGTDY